LEGEYHHDAEAAVGAKRGDYRFMLRPGWNFQ